VFHKAHLISQLLATETIANTTIQLRERAGHCVNVNRAHRQSSLDHLLGHKLVFPLLEHQLDLVAEFTHAHHEFMHHPVQAWIGALE